MIRTLQAFNLKGKNILIRTDFNVPMKGEVVTNNFRIKASLPTIKTCIEAGASVVLMSHLGRPKGKIINELTLKPICEDLSNKLNHNVKLIKEKDGSLTSIINIDISKTGEREGVIGRGEAAPSGRYNEFTNDILKVLDSDIDLPSHISNPEDFSKLIVFPLFIYSKFINL